MSDASLSERFHYPLTPEGTALRKRLKALFVLENEVHNSLGHRLKLGLNDKDEVLVSLEVWPTDWALLSDYNGTFLEFRGGGSKRQLLHDVEQDLTRRLNERLAEAENL